MLGIGYTVSLRIPALRVYQQGERDWGMARQGDKFHVINGDYELMLRHSQRVQVFENRVQLRGFGMPKQ